MRTTGPQMAELGRLPSAGFQGRWKYFYPETESQRAMSTQGTCGRCDWDYETRVARIGLLLKQSGREPERSFGEPVDGAASFASA